MNSNPTMTVDKDNPIIHSAPYLTDDTAKIVKILFEAYCGNEYCYSYQYFTDETGLSKEVVKDFIQILKKWGIVKSYRILKNEDTNLFNGSGWAVVSLEANNLLELALYRHQHKEDRFTGRTLYEI